MCEDYFTPLSHTTSTVSGLLSNVLFKYDDEDFINSCKELFATYSGDISDIDSNFMHLHNPEHPVKKPKIAKKRTVPARRKRRMRGDGTCFESCISMRVRGYYRNVDDEDIENYYLIKVFQNGVMSIPGSRERRFKDILEPLKTITKFMSNLFDMPVKITNLKPTMINYKYYLKPNGARRRQIDIYTAYKTFDEIKKTNLLANMNDVMTFLANHEYSKEELKYYILSTKACVRNLRVNIEELHQLILDNELPAKKKALEMLQEIIGEKLIINPVVYQNIYKRYLESFVIDAENTLRKSIHNLIRHVTYNSDHDPSVMVELQSLIPKKSGKGIKFKIFDSGKINIGGAVDEDSTIYMTQFINGILSDPKNQIIYHDDEDSCTSEDSDDY